MLSAPTYVNASPMGEILSSAYIWVMVSAAVAIFFVTFQHRMRSLLFLVFVLVAWFPEFSQIEDVHTAEEIQTIYNFRPIRSITASVFDYLFLVMVIIWVLRVILPSPRRLLDAPLAKYMIALFVLWTFNLVHGLFRGNEVYYALREFRCQAYFVITFLMIVTVFRDHHDIRKFLKLSLVMALFVGGYGVVRYILGIGFEFNNYLMVYYDISDSILLYFAMLITISFLIDGKISMSRGFLAIALLCPIVFTFLFSYRRGAWLGFAVGLLFLMLLYPNRRYLRLGVLLGVPAAVLSTILLFLVLVPTAQDTVTERAVSIFDISQDSSNIFRILDAMNALHSFVQHPILGVGAGGRYDLEFTSGQVLMSFMEEVNRTSHNGYLYVLFKTGLIGFAIYICVYYKFLRIWFQAKTKASNSIVSAEFMACGAIFIAMLANNMTETVSDLLRPSLLLSFVMGWGAILIVNLRRANLGATQLSKVPLRTPPSHLALPEESLGA
jgi:O-antigen ligase